MACINFNASYRYREKVEEIFTCVYCRKPTLYIMVLPCSLHRACEMCLLAKGCEDCPVCMQDPDTRQPLRSYDRQPIQDFFCREVARENFFKDAMTSESGQTVEDNCNSCNGNSIKVTASCQQCGVICDYCFEAHNKMNALKHHKSTLLSELACGNVTVDVVWKSPCCPNHPVMEIAYYCVDCKMAVCLMGSHVHHRKHEVKFMGDLRQELLAKFNEVWKVTKHWEAKYEELYSEAERLPAALDAELSHAIDRVREMAERKTSNLSDDVTAKYGEGVRMEEKSLILEVTDRKKVLINRVARVRAYIQRTLQQITEATKFSEFLSDQTSRWSIFTVVPQMIELFTSLNEEIIGGTPGLKNYGKMNFDFEETDDESTISFAKIIPLKFWGLKRGWNVKKLSSKAWFLTGLETLSDRQLLITGNRGNESLIGRFDPVRGDFDFNTNIYGSGIRCTAVIARSTVGDELHGTGNVVIGVGKKVSFTSSKGGNVKGEFGCWSETMSVSCLAVNSDTQVIVVGNDCNSELRVFDKKHQLKQIIALRPSSVSPVSVEVKEDRILTCHDDGAKAINFEGECIARYLPTSENKGYVNRAKIIRSGSHGNVFVLWECESEGGFIRKYFAVYDEEGAILSEREVRENMRLMAVLPGKDSKQDQVVVCSSRGWLGIYIYDILN